MQDYKLLTLKPKFIIILLRMYSNGSKINVLITYYHHNLTDIKQSKETIDN